MRRNNFLDYVDFELPKDITKIHLIRIWKSCFCHGNVEKSISKVIETVGKNTEQFVGQKQNMCVSW